MRYTREQDIDAVISSTYVGVPKARGLARRLSKKYGSLNALRLIVDAYQIAEVPNEEIARTMYCKLIGVPCERD